MYGTIALGFDLDSMFDGNLEFVAVILVFTAAAKSGRHISIECRELGAIRLLRRSGAGGARRFRGACVRVCANRARCAVGPADAAWRRIPAAGR